MEKHYFFLPDIKPEDKNIVLTGDEFYHLDKVLRVKTFDIVYLLNGRGYIFKAEVLSKDGKSARIEIMDISFVPEPEVKVILIQAIIKKIRMELLLEKVTELGVSEIVPVITKNCIIKEKGLRETKFNRWQKILIQALKQSANPWLPKLRKPVFFEEILRRYSEDKFLKFILTQEGEDMSTLSRLSLDSGEVGILVGPEGDFTKEELSQAIASGFRPLSLGPLRLHVETASIVAISVFKYLFSLPPDGLG